MRTLVRLVTISAFVFGGAAGSAELYKWVDERGVTNYSSDPPPKGRTAKTIADDRISVYTPDPAVTQAIEAERHRRNAPPAVPPPGSAPPAPRAQAIAPTAPVQYDPCLNSPDPNCYSPTIYDGSPVFIGRGRPPVLNQPQLPPGAIAGNVTGGNGVTPGLSGLTPPVTPPPPRSGNLRPRSTPATGREFSAQ